MWRGPEAPQGLSDGDGLRFAGWLPIPGCGAFVGHCLRTALPGVALPPVHARARPWESWGQPAPVQIGAVLVFWRLHPRAPFGHVGFYWAEDAEAFHVLGGNHRDGIAVERHPKARLTACRWPEGHPQSGLRRNLSR